MPEQNKSIMNEFQPSMTEWFASIGEGERAAEFRMEDNTKDDRLEILYQVINLPYERPTDFAARDLADRTPAFMEFLEQKGDDLCALRLISKRSELPKLRNRGLSIREVYEKWFFDQNINPDDYKASFRPHTETYAWSLIFVIKPEGVFGEMIPGQHVQLTHGDTKTLLSCFRFDFVHWEWQNEQLGAREVSARAVEQLRVSDTEKQRQLREQVEAHFARDYLQGYFEAVLWPDNVIRFSDYNRLIAPHLDMPDFATPATSGITGVVAYAGKVQGRARVINAEQISIVQFGEGDILITDNTDVRFLSLMKKAGAIVTDRGGILSHASIIARELKTPCIVGTQSATRLIKDGDLVEVGADNGVVRILGK